jgi:hypothetical protein
MALAQRVAIVEIELVEFLREGGREGGREG